MATRTETVVARKNGLFNIERCGQELVDSRQFGKQAP